MLKPSRANVDVEEDAALFEVLQLLSVSPSRHLHLTAADQALPLARHCSIGPPKSG